MRQKRIQYICYKIQNESSKEEIFDYLKQKFHNRKNPFNYRTIVEDLNAIRNGEFDYINKNLKPLNKKGHLFNIRYSKSTDKYFFDENSPIPEFDILSDNEKMTVPFLKGILKPFENIPAVTKILDELNVLFDLSEEEIKSAAAVVVTKPQIHNSVKVHRKVIEILEHIKNENCIEFMYTTVHNLNDKLAQSFLCQIIPLQIKLYENLFYLIGLNLNKDNKIVNFRIDKIQGNIDAITDDNTGEVRKFKASEVNKTNLDKYFKNVIGVWCYDESAKTETVKIKFRDWAASYVLAQPLHHSQKVVKNFYKVRLGEREVDEIIISIETRLSARLDYNKNKRTILERSNELTFLLGRFREYAEIIEDNN